jgi:hypothetical protein
MEGVKKVLDEFKGVTGLAINEKKSLIYFSKMGEVEKTMLADIMQITRGEFPVQYLGLPLTPRKWNAQACEKLIERIVGRLRSWDSRKLTYAGRIQLVNTVLLSIASYWICVFKLPEGVHQKKCRRMS